MAPWGPGDGPLLRAFRRDESGQPEPLHDALRGVGAEKILATDAWGFQIGIHAIGTKANNWILNAYEKAQEVNGVRDSRHRSEHAQVLIDEDIPRFAELVVTTTCNPHVHHRQTIRRKAHRVPSGARVPMPGDDSWMPASRSPSVPTTRWNPYHPRGHLRRRDPKGPVGRGG